MRFALTSNNKGELMPTITDIRYTVESRKLEIEDAFWFRQAGETFATLVENFAKIFTIEFGIPMANFALPALSHMFFQT